VSELTDRLYYTDAYLTHFSARVVERDADGHRVILDRSAFYPTSGGQPHDLGTLGGVAVTDVREEDDGRVSHRLAGPLIGDTVDGVVDWGRRWDHMQQHTGQHLLSAVAADRLGWDTLSVHFGALASTVDFATESASNSDVQRLESWVNAEAAANHPVAVSFEQAHLATGLRKPSERDGILRIVSIAMLDRSACGGTHVRATGEIGAITLRRVERIRKATRIEFLCGQRAIARARADFESLTRMAVGLSCSLEELPAIVSTQGAELRSLQNERRRLEEELSARVVREWFDAARPGSDGLRRLIERRAGGKADDSKAKAIAVSQLSRAVFAAVVSSPPAILLSASEDSGVDAGRVLKAALAEVGGRGGGSPRLAQGTTPDRAALEQVVRTLGFDAEADAVG